MEYLNTKILNYRLTRFIGEGGMASVYEGTHEKWRSTIQLNEKCKQIELNKLWKK